MLDVASQAEFARLQGWGRSYVTQLKRDGRLVMTDDGKVRVAESLARIEATKEPNRADVAARHAARRHGEGADGVGETIPKGSGSRYQLARTRKEEALAAQAELDYALAAGDLLPRAVVMKVLGDAVAMIHTVFENRPDHLASQIVGVPDEETVRARLHESDQHLLATIGRELGKVAEKAKEGV